MTATPAKTWQSRRAGYKAQTGSKTLTPAQTRRDLHKRNHSKAVRNAK